MKPNFRRRADHLVSNHRRSLWGYINWHLYRSLSKEVFVGGLPVFMWTDDVGLNVPLRARLALALELIDRRAPRFGARLRRDVKAIVFHPAGGTHLDVLMRAIALDLRWAMQESIENLALTLVHEATHARCRSLGVRYRGKQHREESLCLRAAIEFADLVDPGHVRPPSLDALDNPWWTREKQRARTIEALRIVLRK